MTEFEKAYRQLNAQQRQAVEAIDGPLLVIAGPGTGKTQLIGTRVGYILKNADVEASNILCLTFTEAGVMALRERLEKIIPTQAAKVYISTYHGFGNELIQANPEYFDELRGQPLDELASVTLLRSIVDDLPYSNPLKSGIYYLGDIVAFISDSKRALLQPNDLALIAAANLQFIRDASQDLGSALSQLARISKKSLTAFETIEKYLARARENETKLPTNILPLRQYAQESLITALADFRRSGLTKSLSIWKQRWLANDRAGQLIFAGEIEAKKLKAAAHIYKAYQASLAADGVYDFDDMILKVIKVLEKNLDFKYTLAERFQYLLLDEFQDTNPAQLRLIELLTDHPVHERRPNVLAVGDDDQAIYAFQGADHANMTNFTRLYRDVKVISLKYNYRSPKPLVELGQNLAGQISQRLHHSFSRLEKTLVAANSELPYKPHIVAKQLTTDAAEYEWLANQIKRLIEQGMAASEIAVIAPKHKYLKALLPYLAQQQILVNYEKRDNVLEDPQVMMLANMARLVLALEQSNHPSADRLWAEVISYDFWQIPTEVIWQLSWSRKNTEPWTNLLLKEKLTADIAKFFLRLKDLVKLATLEEMLDSLIGIGNIHQSLRLPIKSSYYDYYFEAQKPQRRPDDFIGLLSNLTVLRMRLRERQRRQTTVTRLPDLIDFIEQCNAAGLNVLNTSPYNQNQDAINLLTAYGAKGKEFTAVFLPGVQSEVWGSASRSKSSVIKLPANLSFITYVGMSDDERLRLFFVAVTRAKTHLYLTSHRRTLTGRYQRNLEFLQIHQTNDGKLESPVLPKPFGRIDYQPSSGLTLAAAQNYWGGRHLPPLKTSLQDLLSLKLQTFRLSATNLNHFIDIERYGPDYFFIHGLLRFPQAPSPTSAFGTAIHATLSWVGYQLSSSGKIPPTDKVLNHFHRQLQGGWLNDKEKNRLLQRGKVALTVWLEKKSPFLKIGDKYEYSFANEGVTLSGARLTGTVDRLIIDYQLRQISVVDVKTGQAYRKWVGGVTKLHKFKQQLMFYKLLTENSQTFRGYQVRKGFIEFVEPDNGEVVELALSFNEAELRSFKLLVDKVWRHIQASNYPDVSAYPKSLKGIKAFEQDLIDGKL